MTLPTTIAALYPFLVLFLQAAAVPGADTTRSLVEVEICPVGKPAVQRILPAPTASADSGESARLLQEAVDLLPADAASFDSSWFRGPIAGYPIEEAKQLLQPLEPAIRKLEQAVGRGAVAWNPPPSMDELSSIRTLAKLLAIKARLEIAEGKFEAAAKSIGSGYALARSMTGQGTEAIHGMVGIALGSLFTEQLLALSQQPDAPSLLVALRALPDPLVDVGPALKREIDGLRTKVPNLAVRKSMADQLESSHARMRQLAAKLRGQIAAVRILEELRGKLERSAELPTKMETPTTTTQPADRVTIEYKRIAPDNAELTVTTGDPSEQVRYSIHLQPAEARSDRKSR